LGADRARPAGSTGRSVILNVLISKPHVDQGAMRALGVTSLKRREAMPTVPTIDESALPGYEALQWFGLLAPAGTPAPILELLQTKLAEGFRTPDMKARLAADGAEPVVSTPAEFGARIKSEIEKWSALAKAANIQPEE
jgi:tripartite-type tricarboxylate transporter receptor subunit TctC